MFMLTTPKLAALLLALVIVVLGCKSEKTRGREALVRLEQSFVTVIDEKGPDDDLKLRSWRGAVEEVDKSGATPKDVLAWAKAWTAHMETSLALLKKTDSLKRELQRNGQEAERELQALVDKGPDGLGPAHGSQSEQARARSADLDDKVKALDREATEISAARRKLFAELDRLRVTYEWEPRTAVMDAIHDHLSKR